MPQQQSITHIIRQRSISNNNWTSQKLQTSYDTMKRLNLENCFDAHIGCVNCLEWNKSGKLLASGSDDHSIVIYDPFVKTKTHDHIRHVVNTDHEGNIFSVKFMPESGDILMATCGGDNQVKLINILTGENYLNCKHCHQDRVKRLAVHHREPNLIWSAGEDGYIMEYDIRDVHNCSQSSARPKNLILDLKTASPTNPIAKCLAINPVRDEMIAVGSTDSCIRLFDRRYIKKDAWNSCIAYFSPGQFLIKSPSNYKKPTQIQSSSSTSSYPCPVSYGTTYVAFSPNGSELLANIHAEQIYLFNTYEPLESFKTFEHTLEPLIFDTPRQPIVCRNTRSNYNSIYPINHWKKLKKYDKVRELPSELSQFYKEMMEKCKLKEVLKIVEFDRINSLLSKIIDCPQLYHLRAAALLQRAWKGDYYQAIRDSCSCLALNPLDSIAYENLAYSAYYLRDKNLANSVLVMINLIRKEFFESKYDYNLELATKALKSLLKDSPSGSPLIWSSSESARSQRRLNGIQMIEATFRERYGQVLNFDYDEVSMTESGESASPITIGANLSDLPIDQNRNKKDFKDEELMREEMKRISNAFDYDKRFCGHCNLNTDIKEANFFGYNGEFIVGGSDDGAFYIWDKKTTNIVKAIVGDQQILNCLQPHPSICMLATSGIESTVKIWSPIGTINRDVKCLEQRCNQNQDFITSDPLEAMIMMLYPNRDELER